LGEPTGHALSAEPRFYTGPVKWLLASSDSELGDALELEGFTVLEWSRLRERWIEPSRTPNMRRSSLRSAAHDWFAWLAEVDRLALVGVRLDGAQAAADLLGFVVEPAARLGIELVIGAEHSLEQLDREALIEPEFGYPYSLERLLFCLRGGQPELTAPRKLADMEFVPDDSQREAVKADSGVVQIIAPAGSGKTAVLIERVRELLRRGASPRSILVVTFNAGARKELELRLEPADAAGVRVATFHGVGRSVLAAARELPSDSDPWAPSMNQWRRLAAGAKKQAGEDGIWFDPPEAQVALSDIKLGRLQTAPEYAEAMSEKSDDRERTLAALYTAYEQMKCAEGERIDYDDMILRAVLLLRTDPALRGRWQHQYQHVLVDEYQDIEWSQELLVRLIAAPQDQLFCVGDEDQTLYAFRRASVARIINLDGLYPGLQRVALMTNYRCPREVVMASRALIEHNHVRFPKEILPFQAGQSERTIERQTFSTQDSAVVTAQALKEHVRGEIVVLGRTTDALRPAALSCADFGVPIDGPKKLFKPTGARLALEDHLRLALEPQAVDVQLIQRVCRTPARSASFTDVRRALEYLQAGESFEVAFEGVAAPRRGRGKLWAPGDLFATLATHAEAAEAIELLRTAGGFDEWFQDADRMGGLDQFECEVLEQAQRDAAGLSPGGYLRKLREQREKLENIRDPKHGIEFSTIHGAKGRQWSRVILLACDEDVLPHKRSLAVSAEELERGEGIEAERRLAYVAFTRAQQRLEIHHDKDRPSRFLSEAGLIDAPAPRAARKPPPPPGLADSDGPGQARHGGSSLRSLIKRLVDPEPR
jgi:superfamily I DNA/RNA helicase